MSTNNLNPEDYYKTLSRKVGEVGLESSMQIIPFEYKEKGKANIGGYEIIIYDAGNGQTGVHINGLGNVDIVFSKDGLILNYYQSL